MNKRDAVEDFLIGKFDSISSFNPSLTTPLEKYKVNNFGLSNVAFALYSNGHNLRGLSTNSKYGLIYEDGESIFSIGYFRKEMSEEQDGGYVFFVAPTGADVISKVKSVIDALQSSNLPIEGYYVRYLTLERYREVINIGGLPIKESPWHPEAPEEDETFTNSIVRIDDVIDVDSGSLIVRSVKGLSKNSKKKIKYAYSRFGNYLRRNSSKYMLRPLDATNSDVAQGIIKAHFEMLKKLGKDIGSTPEDHFNAVDIRMLNNPQCKGFLGLLNDIPVSVFVGENISSDTFALYTPFTIRDSTTIESIINADKDVSVGITAMPTYAYVLLLAEIKKLGFDYVDLGGSEIADLNKFKRQLGGKNKPSYWAYFPKI